MIFVDGEEHPRKKREQDAYYIWQLLLHLSKQGRNKEFNRTARRQSYVCEFYSYPYMPVRASWIRDTSLLVIYVPGYLENLVIDMRGTPQNMAEYLLRRLRGALSDKQLIDDLCQRFGVTYCSSLIVGRKLGGKRRG